MLVSASIEPKSVAYEHQLQQLMGDMRMAAPRLADDEWQRTKAALDAADWNITKAAEALGSPRKTISDRVAAARAAGVIANREDALVVKGRSTLYGKDGEQMLEWVKTSVDQEKLEQVMREAIVALCADIEPAKRVAAPKTTQKDLCVGYIIGDAHVGLYSWADEVGAGADFDTAIAKRDLYGAADRLIASTPDADEAIIAQLGDFFHMDSQANATPRSNNRLDVDTRFGQVVQVGIKVMRYIIDKALAKHKIVRVRNVSGNHDPNVSIMLTEVLRGYYINEPRVVIEGSPRPFWHFRFGSCLVGITHGHGGKPEQYAGQLAVEAREEWGRCEYRYVWHGHFHHKRMIESLGTIVECFRTLAARDAWHAENGYLAGREMQAITLHKDFGEIERHTASLKQVRNGKETSN